MRTKVAYVGIVFAATLLASAIGATGASAAKWQATSPDGGSLTIELKFATFPETLEACNEHIFER